MSHEPSACDHVWSAWTTDPPAPDGVSVQRLKRTCFTCGLVEWEDDPDDQQQP
jgi:hypothetical protein